MSDYPYEFSLEYEKHKTKNQTEYYKKLAKYFENSLGTNLDKLDNFPKFVRRQAISKFLAKNEIFKKIENFQGDIIECGVFLGGGIMTWAQLSAIYEPYNYLRKVVGFDTFQGFNSIEDADKSENEEKIKFKQEGGLQCESFDDLQKCIELYQSTRPLPQFSNVELVRGDAVETIPEYLKKNEHLVISLLYLDFDLYEPTKAAIENFIPRMHKGSIIVFDELNQKEWPGETKAVHEVLGLNNLKIEKTRFSTAISFAQIG